MIESTESFDLADFQVHDGLSFAYHPLRSIPLKLARAPTSNSVKKIDLTETFIRYEKKNLEFVCGIFVDQKTFLILS